MRKLMLVLFVALLWSGVSFAQSQSNATGTVLPSASYTAATVNSQDMSNTNWRGGHFTFNVTAFISGTYTPHIQGKDPVSGVYYDILLATGGNVLSANGITVLKVYPGVGAIAGGATNDILPSTWRVQLIGASTPSMTLSVGFNLDN
jgi:hypothetical protein